MFEDRTYENIKAEILSDVTMTDTREGSFANDMVSPISLQLEGVYAQFRVMEGIFFLTDCTGVYVDKRGNEYGITRKEGTKANGAATFYGEAGAEVPAGSLCGTRQGLLFETAAAGNIGTEGSVMLPILAKEIGDQYNVLAGTINTIPIELQGITSVANGENILGGAGRETDDEMVERILFRLRTPATSGNANHYKMWAMEIDGVGDAKVFPLDNGAGTVTVMPITSGKRSPDQGILTAVAANIEAKRPIGATVTVIAPTEVIVNVTATVRLRGGALLSDVVRSYEQLFQAYIKGSVLKLAAVDYYHALSLFYQVEGVEAVTACAINGGGVNIAIGEKEIQVAGTVEVVAE